MRVLCVALLMVAAVAYARADPWDMFYACTYDCGDQGPYVECQEGNGCAPSIPCDGSGQIVEKLHTATMEECESYDSLISNNASLTAKLRTDTILASASSLFGYIQQLMHNASQLQKQANPTPTPTTCVQAEPQCETQPTSTPCQALCDGCAALWEADQSAAVMCAEVPPGTFDFCSGGVQAYGPSTSMAFGAAPAFASSADATSWLHDNMFGPLACDIGMVQQCFQTSECSAANPDYPCVAAVSSQNGWVITTPFSNPVVSSLQVTCVPQGYCAVSLPY